MLDNLDAQHVKDWRNHAEKRTTAREANYPASKSARARGCNQQHCHNGIWSQPAKNTEHDAKDKNTGS
jgi:hypothetical protein